eukprot:249121-Chlamydomonas_euryale.AAC.18
MCVYNRGAHSGSRTAHAACMLVRAFARMCVQLRCALPRPQRACRVHACICVVCVQLRCALPQPQCACRVSIMCSVQLRAVCCAVLCCVLCCNVLCRFMCSSVRCAVPGAVCYAEPSCAAPTAVLSCARRSARGALCTALCARCSVRGVLCEALCARRSVQCALCAALCARLPVQGALCAALCACYLPAQLAATCSAHGCMAIVCHAVATGPVRVMKPPCGTARPPIYLI